MSSAEELKSRSASRSHVKQWTAFYAELGAVKRWKSPDCLLWIREMKPDRFLIEFPGRKGLGETIAQAQPEHSSFVAAVTAAELLEKSLFDFAAVLHAMKNGLVS